MRYEIRFVPVPPQRTLSSHARWQFDLNAVILDEVDGILRVLPGKVRRNPLQVSADVVCRESGGEMAANVFGELAVSAPEEDAREESFATVSVERDDGVDVSQERP